MLSVAKVSELKAQAREYEKSGDVAKALAIYRHILTHLENTPAIKGELPLYVKAGDLFFKEGDGAAAIEMYRRAAEHYALHGSAQSIVALCLKIMRVDPGMVEPYHTYAGRLLEHGHVSAAREVLADSAMRLKLPLAEEALAAAADVPDEEKHSVIQRVFAAGPGQDLPPRRVTQVQEGLHLLDLSDGPATTEAQTPSSEDDDLVITSSVSEEPLGAEPQEPAAPPEPEPDLVVTRSVMNEMPVAEETVDFADPVYEPPEPPEPQEPEPFLHEEEPAEPEPAAPVFEAPLPRPRPSRDPGPSFVEFPPRPSRQTQRPRRTWVVVAAGVAVVILVGVALVSLGVLPGGGSDDLPAGVDISV